MRRIDRERSKLSNDAYRRLIDAMLDGTLAPGERLVQDQLAERLDVSRTPVRDALVRLHSEGIIAPTGRRGYVVTELSPDEVRDNYDARIAIESHAAMRVTERGDSAVGRVRAALEDSAVADFSTARSSFAANRAFHETVVRATENAELLLCCEAVWGRALSVLIYRDYYVASPADEFVRSHGSLVEIFERGDPDGSRRAMIAHIEDGIAHTPMLTETETSPVASAD